MKLVPLPVHLQGVLHMEHQHHHPDFYVMIILMIILIKMAIYCPQGSGTLRQQLLMMH